jgi:hypothetical protein
MADTGGPTFWSGISLGTGESLIIVNGKRVSLEELLDKGAPTPKTLKLADRQESGGHGAVREGPTARGSRSIRCPPSYSRSMITGIPAKFAHRGFIIRIQYPTEI